MLNLCNNLNQLQTDFSSTPTFVFPLNFICSFFISMTLLFVCLDNQHTKRRANPISWHQCEKQWWQQGKVWFAIMQNKVLLSSMCTLTTSGRMSSLTSCQARKRIEKRKEIKVPQKISDITIIPVINILWLMCMMVVSFIKCFPRSDEVQHEIID